MVKYYEIIPVASKRTTIFDAIQMVADATNKYYYEILLMMGFHSDADLVSYCNNNPNPHFNRMAFVTTKLNDICKGQDAPLRVIRPGVSAFRKEKQSWI